MHEPLISLKGLRRDYASGDGTITVLKDIDLTIETGEMVAIIGASGSGKSTLMNILGLLDRPTSGTYRISGQETAALDNDALSALRREHFGFIFQRYHLLEEISALANVEIPAVYAGLDRGQRRLRAASLLGRLGMAERIDHRPGHLSGGQQQRVSIARALMNDADVILADEPTGALDKASGEEVLRILDELHAEGHTIIIVTHDANVAARAGRIIEISDGEIVSDTQRADAGIREKQEAPQAPSAKNRMGAGIDRFREAFLMACKALQAHRMRSFLTMLGIIIGIASVISVVALGTGSQRQVLANISSLGTNTLEIFPGEGFGDMRSGRVKTLVVSDADALAKLPYVAAVTPTVSTSATARFGATEANALVNGVGSGYFDVKGSKLLAGRFFDTASIVAMDQDAVIDENTAKTLFGGDADQAIGRVIFVGSVPCRIIGVISSQQGGFGSSDNLSIYLPYTSVQARVTGDMSLRSLTLKISDDAQTSVAEQAVTAFLTGRHGTKDFFVLNTDDIRQTITSTTQTMTLLVGAIAVISLIVGGIGVMNIMLVSVSERIGEIGVRMAVGARRQDILQQFLIEAVLVCLIGGVLGVALALLFGGIFSLFGSSFGLVFTATPIVAAVASACLIGIAFGYLPARNASRLDPVAALA
ncbi:MacB family efflux pump subunit [Neorhizobium alkalisoli]|uniref:Pyoverdine export ATP-binding/permease protein PvdT n=1 Tax=Neorhizobium alkalisoli TaxID=528178 RepID=A0A561Q871_9HYPH|nr:MacB family efflux pump subunit [Neorhizobium alkalisoli]TWF46550.1 macrolide transport system ATP-binding/permease protein [Neorhizobium alkalisoli]